MRSKTHLQTHPQTQLQNNHTAEIRHCGYLDALISTDDLRESIERCIGILQNYDFTSIAFRGMSGALIAPSLALAMNKTMLMVRKPTSPEDTHSRLLVEGDYRAESYIIVDDFICTGYTVREIIKQVNLFCCSKPKCLGVLEVNWVTDKGCGFSPIPRPMLKNAVTILPKSYFEN